MKSTEQFSLEQILLDRDGKSFADVLHEPDAPLDDADTGGCRDGLKEDRIDEDQDAEPTISPLLALLERQAADKDAALLPIRISGDFALVHRPVHPWGTHVWISFSPDLRNSGGQQLMRRARNGGWRGANELGLSPPLMATPGGSLMIDHGVRQTAAGAMYPFGLAPLALDQRQVCLPGGDSWVLGPETGYDRQGDVGNVTFPCGFTIGTDGDTIHLYYGTADTCIAFATGSGRGLLGWLSRWGRVCAPTE